MTNHTHILPTGLSFRTTFPPKAEFQREAIQESHPRQASLLDMYMGTGKSYTACALLQSWNSRRVLILCPKEIVTGVWPGEFEKHFPAKDGEQIDPWIQIVFGKWWRALCPKKHKWIKRASGNGKTKAAAMRYSFDRINRQAADRRVVVIINHEAAWRPEMSAAIQSVKWDAIIVDESHKGKSAQGAFSKWISRLPRWFPEARRLALTGTFLPHDRTDAFGQLRFIDPMLFGYSFVHFRNRYCVMGGFDQREIIGYQHEEEFFQKIASVSYHAGKEVLDLPGIQEIAVWVELDAAELRTYGDINKQMAAEIPDAGVVTVEHAMTRTQRLLEITDGFTTLDPEEDAPLTAEQRKVAVGCTKLDALSARVEQIDASEPIVIFAHFTHSIRRALERMEEMGRPVFELTGRKKQKEDWDASAARGEGPVIVCQYKAASLGIDFTASCYVFYYGLTWDGGDFEQSRSRAWRMGQTRSVSMFYIMAKGTMDPVVHGALTKRESVARAVQAEIEKEREKRRIA